MTITLGMLHQLLADKLDDGVDPDTPVAVAVQPSYPLAVSFQGIYLTASDKSPARDNAFLFLVAGGYEPDHYGSPYAPRDAWDEVESIP